MTNATAPARESGGIAFGEGPGACEQCGGRSVPIQVGSDTWFRCTSHDVCWCVGSNLTVSPEEDVEQIGTLRGCRLVPNGDAMGYASRAELAAHERLRETLKRHA
jgi:hypothetical protein